MPSWLSGTWVVVSFFVGIASTHASAAWADRRAHRREREARGAEREKVAVTRRETFELEHLVDLHAAMTRQIEATMHAHIEDSAGDELYGAVPRRGETNEALQAAYQTTRALVGFVLVGELRVRAEKACTAMHLLHMMRGAPTDEVEVHFHESHLLASEVQDEIAERVREIYGASHP